jgi:hypothetical protein
MIKQENLAANFCGLLLQQGFKGNTIRVYVSTIFYSNLYASPEKCQEWRILGQEQDGSLMSTWTSYNYQNQQKKSHIGMYNPVNKIFEVLYTFPDCRNNIIQASINCSQTLLVFIVKDVYPDADNVTNK